MKEYSGKKTEKRRCVGGFWVKRLLVLTALSSLLTGCAGVKEPVIKETVQQQEEEKPLSGKEQAYLEKEEERRKEERQKEEAEKAEKVQQREQLEKEAEETHLVKQKAQEQKVLDEVEIMDRKRVYPVKEGDDLKKIAGEIYGDEDCWTLIYEANKELLLNDPENLAEDMYLILPENGKELTWDMIYEDEERMEDCAIYRADIEKELSYSIEEHYYYKNEKDAVYGKWEEDEGHFNVAYPQLVFADGRDATAANESIRNCAMRMVNKLYLHPSDEVTELFETDDDYMYDWRVSKVFYQITYMDENLISIVFQDSIFMGNIFTESYEMRGITINVNTGHVYTRAELFEEKEQLAAEVHDRIQSYYKEGESSYETYEGAMDEALFARLMEAEEWLDGRYCGIMFLSGEGLHLGVSFRSNHDGLIWRGYDVTAFTDEEIAPYQSRSDFWKYMPDSKEERAEQETDTQEASN